MLRMLTPHTLSLIKSCWLWVRIYFPRLHKILPDYFSEWNTKKNQRRGTSVSEYRPLELGNIRSDSYPAQSSSPSSSVSSVRMVTDYLSATFLHKESLSIPWFLCWSFRVKLETKQRVDFRQDTNNGWSARALEMPVPRSFPPYMNPRYDRTFFAGKRFSNSQNGWRTEARTRRNEH